MRRIWIFQNPENPDFLEFRKIRIFRNPENPDFTESRKSRISWLRLRDDNVPADESCAVCSSRIVTNQTNKLTSLNDIKSIRFEVVLYSEVCKRMCLEILFLIVSMVLGNWVIIFLIPLEIL